MPAKKLIGIPFLVSLAVAVLAGASLLYGDRFDISFFESEAGLKTSESGEQKPNTCTASVNLCRRADENYKRDTADCDTYTTGGRNAQERRQNRELRRSCHQLAREEWMRKRSLYDCDACGF